MVVVVVVWDQSCEVGWVECGADVMPHMHYRLQIMDMNDKIWIPTVCAQIKLNVHV